MFHYKSLTLSVLFQNDALYLLLESDERSQMMKKGLFYLFYGLSPVWLIHTLYMANPDKYSKASILISMLIGAMAYTWLIWQFVFSARPKFIEFYIGLGQVYRLHGIMAVVALLLVIGHKTIEDWYFGESLLTTLGSAALIIFLSISILSLAMMSKERWLKLPLFKHLDEVVQRYKYETNKRIHNLTIIALILMQVHIMMTSSVRRSSKVFYVFMIYFMVAFLFYVYHKVFKPWIQKEYPCRVVAIKKESPNIWSIFFKAIEHQVHYLPGQFGFFSMIINERREMHPFSFSSSPTSEGIISITVKKLGDFTDNVHALKVGDTMTVEGPYGEFSYLNHDDLFLYMIAGGVGITPMISMLRHLRQTKSQRPVILLWGVRKEEDLIFDGELAEMTKEMRHLTVVPVLSDAPDHQGEKGYITASVIEKYLIDTGFQIDHTGFYICGPPVLMKNSIRTLRNIGIKKEHIHYETFSM